MRELWKVAYETLSSRARKRIKKDSAKEKPISFEPGDAVLVKSHHQSSAENKLIKKFFLLYEGPFYVVRCAGNNSYIIGDELGNKTSKQNVVNLKPYKNFTAYQSLD